MKNCLVAQSGGPTVAINASLAGVIEAALKSDQIAKVYGGRNGVQGILEGKLVELNSIFENHEQRIQQLIHTPSMYLGSCRYKMKDINEDTKDYDRMCEVFEQYDIGYFFYIGGNDSMDTVAKLAGYTKSYGLDVKVVGIPKTIDNDLTCIDHTPGFGSAAKFVAISVLEMAHDIYVYPVNTVMIVEIMGRNAGWLTAASCLARNEYSEAPHLIYLPEKPFIKSEFISQVRRLLAEKHYVVIAVSEGIKDENGIYISAQGEKADQFGHIMLSGTGEVLKNMVADEIGCKVRSVELNVLQRAASHCASETDLKESYQLGVNGVQFAMEGQSGIMSTAVRISDAPYELRYESADIKNIANEEKMIPSEWITENGCDVTEEMLTYLKPLIQGEAKVEYKDGMPQYLFALA